MRLEHIVSDHLVKMRCGDAFNFAIPTAPTYGNPSVPLDYRAPLPFEGKREPSAKSPFNYRGTMVGINDNRLMPFESLVERKSELIFQTDHRILRIEPQPCVLAYTAVDGKKRRHIIDFLLHKVDGTRLLVAAKPTLLLVSSGLLDLLLRLKDQGRFAGIADDVTFVTERFATDDAAYNASEILKARRLRNESDYQGALSILDNVKGPIRFSALLTGAQIPAHRRIALWNLIDEKRLRPVEDGRIENQSIMTVNL